MPSQLIKNDGISFLACKPFTYRGTEYSIGDDFPQEEANNIETLVRSRFVIPVLEEGYLRPRHWHGHIRTREQGEEYLNRSRVQLRMPDEYDSDEVVDLGVLTHPHTTPPAEELEAEAEEQEAEQVKSEYDPSEHTVAEVKEHLEEYPEDTERVLALEADGRARKGILEE
jgi:hypothetical protein